MGSGNSYLHFHLMAGPEPQRARGPLRAFSGYERKRGDGWEEIRRGVPRALERIRV